MKYTIVIVASFFFCSNECNAQTARMTPDSISPTNNSKLSRKKGISTGGSTTSDKRKTWTPKPDPAAEYLNNKIEKFKNEQDSTVYIERRVSKDTLN